jgi:DNA-binding MarR family transcriptional regulator
MLFSAQKGAGMDKETEEKLGSMLSLITLLEVGVFKRQFRKTGLTWFERLVLVFADIDPEITATSICRMFQMQTSSVNYLLNKLEKLECVTLEVSERDRRLRVLVLTEKGKKEAEQLRRMLVHRIKQWFPGDKLELMLPGLTERVQEEIHNLLHPLPG